MTLRNPPWSLQIWGGSNALKKIGIDLCLGDPCFAAMYLTVPPLMAGGSFAEAATVLNSQIGETLKLNYQVNFTTMCAAASLVIRLLSDYWEIFEYSVRCA